jgi:hypothetical protein
MSSLKENIENIQEMSNWLISFADDIESSFDEEKLNKFNAHLLQILDIFETAFSMFDSIQTDDAKSENDLHDIIDIANALDDAGMKKQADVLDDLLIALGNSDVERFKKKNEDEIDKLKKKYRDARGDAFKAFGDQKPADNEQRAFQEQAKKDIEAKVKKYRPLEAPLQTRVCQDHPGVQMTRIDDGVSQCPVDKKIYDYNNGFVTQNGGKVPGTSVKEQNKLDYTSQDSMSFATRDGILNGS